MKMNSNKDTRVTVPRPFKALCRMIMRQEVTYAEAWESVQDIVISSIRGLDGGVETCESETDSTRNG